MVCVLADMETENFVRLWFSLRKRPDAACAVMMRWWGDPWSSHVGWCAGVARETLVRPRRRLQVRRRRQRSDVLGDHRRPQRQRGRCRRSHLGGPALQASPPARRNHRRAGLPALRRRRAAAPDDLVPSTSRQRRGCSAEPWSSRRHGGLPLSEHLPRSPVASMSALHWRLRSAPCPLFSRKYVGLKSVSRAFLQCPTDQPKSSY